MTSPSPLPRTIILMGVSGCGKTLIGEKLAPRFGAVFEDADNFHTPAAKEKMRAGIALTDDDRWPWYARLRARIEEMRGQAPCYILACSALKQIYRDKLSIGEGHDLLRFVFMDGSFELISGRLSHRKHEYMPASLLKSQFDTLERPADAVIVSIDKTPDAIVDEVASHFTLP